MNAGFPAGFHLLGGGVEGLWGGGGSSLGPLGVKNKVCTKFLFWGGVTNPPQNGPAGNPGMNVNLYLINLRRGEIKKNC